MDWGLAGAVIGTSLNSVSVAGLSAGAVNQFLLDKVGGNALARAGLHYAATGGELTKGVFVWQGPNPEGQLVYNTFTFQMNPEELNHSYAPDWATVKVPGQNDPQYVFIHGGEKTLSFCLHMFYESRENGFITGRVNLLRQLITRPYSGVDTAKANNGPPALYFYYGSHIKGERFIMSRMDVKCFDLFDPAYLLPMRAEVQIELKSAPAPDNFTPNGLFPSTATRGSLSSILKAAL